MSGRTLFATLLWACLLGIGVVGSASAADVGESVKPNVIEDHGFRPLIFPPSIGPGWASREYPYYYSRGYYPTHVGRYVYRGPFAHGDDYAASEADGCSKWHRACAGSGKEDYDGCMEQHDCD